MNSPKHTIIVPSYNTGDAIRKCIDSIILQTYTNWELIVVDDGSQDATPAIIDEYTQKDVRIRAIHIPNGGVSNARNIGLDNAKGEYVMFVDSDDWIESDYLQQIESRMEDNSDLYIAGITQDFQFEDGCLSHSKVLVSPIHKKLEKGSLGQEFGYLYSTINLASACLKTYRTQIIRDNNIKFDKRIILLEDFHFVLSYLMCKPNVSLLPFVGYHYVLPVVYDPIARRKKVNLYPSIHLVLEKFDEACEQLDFSDHSKKVFLLASKGIMNYAINRDTICSRTLSYRIMAKDSFYKKHVNEMLNICGARFRLRAKFISFKLYILAGLVN